MNKLVFSEGGQPVCLDDLRMLQDNMREIVLSLLPLTKGGNDVMDVDRGIGDKSGMPVYASARHISGDLSREDWPGNHEILGGCEVWVQPHLLFTSDGVYSVGGVWLEYDSSRTLGSFLETLYYVLSEETVESRTFEDGQLRPVVKRLTARIVEGEPGSGSYYKFTDVASFTSLMLDLVCEGKEEKRYNY